MAIVKRTNRDGSLSFLVRVLDQDRNWFPAETFTDRLEAEAREIELKRKARRGALSFSKDSKTVTVAEYWEVWSVENRPKVGKGWRISQDQMWRDFILPVIGKRVMRDVDAPKIGRVLNRMRELGKSEQMVLHVYSLLRRMFSDAVSYYKMLPDTPVIAKSHRPEVVEKEAEYLSPEQAQALLAGVLRLPRHSYLAAAVWIPTLAGLRSEATLGLMWDCVNFQEAQIEIRRFWKQKTRSLEAYSKGKRADFVPMTPPLQGFLWEKFNRERPRLTDFVCQGKKGGRLSYNTYERAVKTICRHLNLPIVSPHGLRHSSTELWVRAGANQLDLSRLLNHKSPATTRRYMHRADGCLRSLSANVGKGLVLIEGGGSFTKSFTSVKQTAERALLPSASGES